MSLNEALIGPRGIMLDREYMLVDEHGVFVSQRNARSGDTLSYGVRSLCLVVPGFRHSHLTVQAPEMPELQFPLYESSGEKLQARIWKSCCDVQEVSSLVSDWFTTYVNRERPGRYRLVRMLDACQRTASGGTALTAFADGFPFLIASQESLDELNLRIDGPAVGINRFRPSILVKGSGTPHAEDTMDKIRISEVEFEGQWLCDRCPMPGIEQETGKKDGRPLHALARYRRMKAGSDKVQFGRNFNHLNPGRIQVGDEVEVIA
jgi:uncharacterized protein YcbX